MNNKIEQLEDKLSEILNKSEAEKNELQVKLQKEFDKVFSDNTKLNRQLSDFENGSLTGSYYFDEFGDLERWTDFDASDFCESEYFAYLAEYISENHCFTLNTELDVLISYCGNDYIAIQQFARHDSDNGVYQNHKQIIKESEYKLCDSCEKPYDECIYECESNSTYDICEKTRNELIEKHMETTGCFPEVGTVNDRDNEFTLISTQTKDVK